MNLFDCVVNNLIDKKLNKKKSCRTIDPFVFAEKENNTIFFSLLSSFLTCDKMI